MTFDIRLLGAGDEALLLEAPADLFDAAVDPALAREFLGDPRHHIAVAVEGGAIIGFASGVHYVHPDKPAELFVNEAAVLPTHQRRGIATALMQALLRHGRGLGCANAWLATERSNTAAMALYAALQATETVPDPVLLEFNLTRLGTGGG
ncbi:hypothetical protein sos41_04410 [Alphaproteobacteria bacterium SO-S41]|nr:hypothetical protein sos41_04410 [Alphaproteobacteria bacterium SO-S41]